MNQNSSKEKIGIITHYYNSNNYGGILQAYALCTALNKRGYNAEQIQYKEPRHQEMATARPKMSFLQTLKKPAIKFIAWYNNIPFKRRFRKKRISLRAFREQTVPHSRKVYSDRTLSKTVERYSVFIVGSDQVWNPNYYQPGYYLSFVPPKKKKISYAASLAVDSLTHQQRDYLQKNLKGFNAISVREAEGVKLLSGLTTLDVDLVLDPTLLLSAKEWDEIASNRRIQKNYIFAFLFGESEEQRQIIREFAKIKELCIVTIPYIWETYRKCDDSFGDIELYDVSPQDLISLVKNADYIFTDSFHVVAFSCIYNKAFFALNRDGMGNMSSRIYNILELFDLKNRFCDSEDKLTLSYLINQQEIDYQIGMNRLLNMQERSISFLTKNLRQSD